MQVSRCTSRLQVCVRIEEKPLLQGPIPEPFEAVPVETMLLPTLRSRGPMTPKEGVAAMALALRKPHGSSPYTQSAHHFPVIYCLHCCIYTNYGGLRNRRAAVFRFSTSRHSYTHTRYGGG